MAGPESDDELRWLRDRVRESLWRLDALDKWRDKTDLRIGKCEDGLGKLLTAEVIAEEVSQRIQVRDGVRLSRIQKVIAGVIASTTMAAAIVDILSKVHHL